MGGHAQAATTEASQAAFRSPEDAAVDGHSTCHGSVGCPRRRRAQPATRRGICSNRRRELFVCHATGTSRWDLPKGVQDPGESALQATLREVWEETSRSRRRRWTTSVCTTTCRPSGCTCSPACGGGRVSDRRLPVPHELPASRHRLAGTRGRRLCLEAPEPARRLVRQEHDKGAAGARLAAHRAAA